jgi:hypothetical protein
VEAVELKDARKDLMSFKLEKGRARVKLESL